MESNASVSKAAAGAHGAVDRASLVAHQVVDQAAGVAAPTADWLGAKAEAALAAPGKLAEGGLKIVTDHPWKALGVALAVGALVGRILR